MADGIPEMLPLREVSVRSGLSYDAVRKLCMSGKVVHIRVGRKYFVNWGRFVDFLNNGGERENEE